MNLRLIPSLSGCALVATLALPDDARACGGCFVQSETTVVTAHRMALAISPVQTVLWDQIQYAGNPAEFAWVLPVKPGAVLELSTDAWVETLDAATTVRVSAPPVNCPSPEFGCGDSDAEDFGGTGGGGGLDNGSVTVVHRGTVGPYETVTLSTAQPGALNQWLSDHNYAVNPVTQPVIDAYVAEGFDFIALRLQPGKNVNEMKPVRVISPGATPTLPLRMVAVGTGAYVAITLFVITEGRMAAKNFANTLAPLDLLAWDFQTQKSNYAELRKLLLTQNEGRTWMTTYAHRGALLSSVGVQYATMWSPAMWPGGMTVVDTIAEAYVAQGIANGETTDASCANRLVSVAFSTDEVADPCPPGVPSNDPSCGMVAPGQIDARTLECGTLADPPGQRLDDMAVALTGMHPADVWLTRLEANLPQATLKTDLDVEPAEHQENVSNLLQARLVVNLDDACPSGVTPIVIGPDPRGARAGGAMLGVLFAATELILAVIRRLARPRALSRG